MVEKPGQDDIAKTIKARAEALCLKYRRHRADKAQPSRR